MQHCPGLEMPDRLPEMTRAAKSGSFSGQSIKLIFLLLITLIHFNWI